MAVAVLVTALIATALWFFLRPPFQRPGDLGDQVRNSVVELADEPTVQRAFLEGRREAIEREDQLTEDLLEQNMREWRAMFENDDVREEMLELNLDMVEAILESDELSKRFGSQVIEVFQQIAEDPQLRPEMISVMLDLLNDSRIQSQLTQLIQTIVGQMAPPAGGGGTDTGGAGGQ